MNNINHIHGNCCVGIVIGEPEQQGKGFGNEAMKLIINYSFNTLNMNKISLEVVENNIAALNLYRKLGFIEEGRLKRHFYLDGKYFDVFVLSLFRK